MKRFLLLLVLVVAGVVVAALEVPSPAASVNGAAISRHDVNTDLTAITSSPNYECFVRANLALASQGQAQVQVGGVGASGSFNGTYNVNFADYTVEQLIDEKLVDQAVRARGLVITASDLAIGRSVLNQRVDAVLNNYAQMLGLPAAPCGGSASAVLSSLPTSFVTEQVQAQTAQAVLAANAVGASLDTGAVERYFVAHRAEFDTVCVSDIAVATQAQAASIRALIISGASTFAAQAQANSIDSSTKSNGGAAGCGPAVTFGLSAPLSGVAVGQITQPISDNGAFVLITVTSRTPSSFTSSVGLVRSVILAVGQPKVQGQLTAALRRSSITADPRYGRVVQGSASLLVPPKSPPSSSLIAPQANVPGASTLAVTG